MNEEENQAPEEQEDEHEQEQSSARGRSVFPYLAVLFATAFLLLLFAYLMQQRDSEEITGYLSDLRESMGSIQSIDQLVEENRVLRQELDTLTEQVAALEEENEGLNETIKYSEAERHELNDLVNYSRHYLDKVITAMGLFWEIDEAYMAEDFDLCRELVTRMEELAGPDPADYLAEPDGENGLTRSASERYQEIVEALKEAEN